jgi:hypothetical protein
MKKTAVTLALLGLLALGGQAAAVICTIDQVPASTLLLPYFEVDLNNPNGLTTLFSINNASATAILVKVEIWTDLSVPVLDFSVYLTGYDVQSINLRDIIVNGNLPQTASAGQDPTDTISPKGSLSQDINFASCTSFLPPPAIPAATLAYLQAALTGNPISGLFSSCAGPPCCAAQNLGDHIARGYITADTVVRCDLFNPSSPNYFTTSASFQNVLFGDWFIVNTTQNFAEGGDLVHIESAAPGFSYAPGPAYPTLAPNTYTFYGRYVAWNASDRREPLADEFATRYLNGGPFSAGTSLLCWRDSKTVQFQFSCPAAAGNPSWYPLAQEGIVVFDEQEHPLTSTSCVISPCPTITQTVCPAETQRVQVGGPSLPVNSNFGWLFMDLNNTIAGNPNPPSDPAAAQAWVISTLASNGHFAVGLDAIRLDSSCNASHFFP